MLSVEEIQDIIEDVTHIILKANRSDELDGILKFFKLREYYEEPEYYLTTTKGKIVVIGESSVKEKALLGIAKKFGFGKDRFEFCLDYNLAKTYDYKKLKNNPFKYSVVLFGPVPHSSTGKNHSNSVISNMTNESGYPKTEKLLSGNMLKITKTNFKKMLIKLIKEGVIEP